MHWCCMFICQTLHFLCNMAVHLRILVILTGLTGIHSITTVSEVSVKAGGSISIPCLYEPRYINNVKYLCEGSPWISCKPKVKTNSQSSRKFSISDDKIQRIFTVTIKDLKEQDPGHYWCAVEINDWGDEGKYFHLSVTRGTPTLIVDRQEIQGFVGEKITIKCHHFIYGVIKWCRVGGSCVMGPSGSIEGTTVTIDRRVPNVFTVTMSGLKTESSGWYWCDKGGFQMPVHLTVTEKPTTTTVAPTTLLTTTPEPENLPTAFVDKNNITVQSERQSDSNNRRILIILLSLLIFIAIVTLFIWFMLKKHKQAKAAASATTAEVDVTYCNIEEMRKTSSQTSYSQSDVDVMYSSVVFKKPKRVLKVEANDDSVTYSTLA